MSKIYERIENLCKNKGINVTLMCREADIPRSALTDLKMGRTKELSTKTVAKIASYFSISMEEILGNEQKKEAPTPKSERDIENEAIIEKLESDEALRAAVLRFLGM